MNFYIEKIRGFVNYSHYIDHQYISYRTEKGFNKKYYHLCSALDALGDAECAIDDYLKLKKLEGRGINYVYIYGILQVLNLRNEALINVYNTLMKESIFKKDEKGIYINEDEDFQVIRLLRNKLVAHPFNNDAKDHAYGIAVHGLNTFGFFPYRFDSSRNKEGIEENKSKTVHEKVKALKDGDITPIYFDIEELINHQNNKLEKYLKEICAFLDEERKRIGEPKVPDFDDNEVENQENF
ncbi:hypothetical protein HPC38_05790 [Pasteurellaceae bacterium HPA106]|uniref:hypothetical protein n=1 Tax=Spirabiliibacterium pneumoniae TaxID=221400 RepID=UPI001AACEBCF|nr:hypothetical protein [Spirabiliibacterium pneumoniae]MBE2896384.1 hypothetical protein [Spirabiliibacterium pneumoniae]